MAHSPLANSVIRAKNYTNASRTSKDMRVVVIHTMESPEAGDTAESVSRWAAGPTAPEASWHYAVDSNSIVSCVEEEDVAWAAPGANHDGVQIELAGRAGQTPAQWADAYSKLELVLAAKLVADICKRRGIPARKLINAELAGGSRGVIGHVQASQVYKQSSHWDPGPSFPWADFMRDVKALMPDKRRWIFVLEDSKGNILARSKAVGVVGYVARLTGFATRQGPAMRKLSAAGRGPRIRSKRVA